MDIIMFGHILLYCCLYRCRDKEILLFQTKLLTCIMIVIRVKDFYNILSQVVLLYCLLVITFIKGIQTEAVHRLCIPDSKSIHYIIAITYDRQVIRDSLN